MGCRHVVMQGFRHEAQSQWNMEPLDALVSEAVTDAAGLLPESGLAEAAAFHADLRRRLLEVRAVPLPYLDYDDPLATPGWPEPPAPA